nr:glycosyltransferase family 4 protein [Agrobacterium sp. rho-13.3]MDX8311745.1 glycosyltransferase family 4 protein [Agrobacterium sp. rho-13.3]
MGGVSTLAYEVTRALGASGHDCVYVGPRGINFGRRLTNFRVYEDWECDLKLRAGEGADLEDERIFDLLKKISEGYSLDATIAFHPFYYGLAAVQAAKFLEKPSAVMVHGTELTSQFPTSIDQTVDKHVSDVCSLPERLRKTISSTDFVLTNSNFTSDIARRISPDIQTEVIGCGISEKILDHLEQRTPSYQAKLKSRRRLRIGLSSETLIAYVGRFVAHKNLFQLIDLGAASGFQVLMMGNGPLRDELETYANLRGAKVTFDNDADDEKKWQVLEASDFGYLMSTFDSTTGGFEGFGISMLEYCAAGAVCITSGANGMADFASNEVTTLDIHDESGEISVSRLKSFAADEARMNSVIYNARLLIREDYTWESVAKKIVETFQ